MVRGWAVVLCVSACGFQEGRATSGDGAAGADAPGLGDAAGDGAACAAWSFAPSNFDPCTLPAGAPLAVGSGATYTLDASTTLPHALSMQGNGVRLLVVHLTAFDLQGTLVTAGEAAVVLAVDGPATIGASAVVNARGGADSDCGGVAGVAGMPSTQNVGGGGGGGGAGSGDGGDGTDGDGIGRGAHGMHGMHVAGTFVPMRGGCSGGAGGTDNGTGTPGTGGAGGGGIEISSNTSVTVSGAIAAVGGGGGASDARTGGGGGGGGGAIFLEGPLVHLQTGGVLCADGGSGSQGGGMSTNNAAGVRSPCTGLVGANAQNVGNYGGGGGDGGYLGMVNGTAAVAPQGGGQGGGGGGGGGAGWIHIHATTTRTVDIGSVITPADQ